MLKAEALAPQTAYTKTATYLTYDDDISIAPLSNALAQQTCATPAGAKFWWLSTRTHKFAFTSSIINLAANIAVSTDWEHPTVATYSSPNFLVFSSGLTYACHYYNPSNNTVHEGDSELTEENCMGIGYFFPATHSAFCLGSAGPL